MIEMRARHSRSWMDARYGRILANKTANKLVARCQDEKVLKIELTYDRSEYANPEDLYDCVRAERHIRRFIASLAIFLGCSLKGKWLCKMEFQHGGWVHWHLILLGVDYINHAELMRLWGHGYVWIRRAGEADLRYTCKYFAKEDGLPDFLYLQPIRSVKFIRASPGFWNQESVLDKTTEPNEVDKAIEVAMVRDRVDPPQSLRLPIYTSIGQMIETGEAVTVCRDDQGHYIQVHYPIWQILTQIKAHGVPITGTKNGWIQFPLPTVSAVLTSVTPPAVNAAGPRSGPRHTAGLHLIYSTNPPKLPKWLQRVFEYQFGWRDMGS
ncbi:MAG: hypothetical protein M0Z50_00745 [Planctomycetia bacterium]|nr:hypothetical protein [Planctomycetia bacterium]